MAKTNQLTDVHSVTTHPPWSHASKIMDLDLNGNCAASEVGNCTVESPTALLFLTMWPSILPFELKFSEIFLKLARSTTLTLTVIPLKKL